MEIRIQIQGREEVQLHWPEGQSQPRIQAIGSLQFLKTVEHWKRLWQGPVESWPIPEANTTAEILLRELVLRAQGKWKPPYEDPELCHCRAVPLAHVLDAIRAGAHDSQAVSRWTSASTACGTCRPDVEALLNYHLISQPKSA